MDLEPKNNTNENESMGIESQIDAPTSREDVARELDLSPDASWLDIRDAVAKNSFAHGYGERDRDDDLFLKLPREATDEEVCLFRLAGNEIRKAQAIKEGLTEDATWSEIYEKGLSNYAVALGLAENATQEEIHEVAISKYAAEMAAMGLGPDANSEVKK